MKTISHGHFGPNTVPGESTSESVKEAHEHTNVSYDPYQHNAVEQANEHMQANAPKHMQGSYHADQDYADLGDDNRVYDTRHACSTAAEALTQLHLHTHAHSDLDHHDHMEHAHAFAHEDTHTRVHTEPVHNDANADDHFHDHDSFEFDTASPSGTDLGAANILVIRPISGLSGDMLIAGLARMAEVSSDELAMLAVGLGMPSGCVRLELRSVSTVNGWTARVTLREEHVHRTLGDIRHLIEKSNLTSRAQQLALSTFVMLATAEARIHGISIDDVTFHEIGALDSILDIGLACLLFDRLSPTKLVCGPLPLCDGVVRCDHGLLPAPAPAVLSLLPGVPIRGIASDGETVTPTAIALLRGFSAQFGIWPEMTVSRTALVYGTRLLPGVPNGALFALGQIKLSTNTRSVRAITAAADSLK